MSDFHLIVHNPFGGYAKGALISNATEVQRILSGDNRANVHRIVPVATAQPPASEKPEKQG
jgi:hypothetical protein